MANTYEYKPHQNPERERRRALAQAMMQRGMSGQPTQGPLAPIYGPADSAADIISALAGQRMNNKLRGEETADRDAYNKTMADALRGPQAPVDGVGPVEDKNQHMARVLSGNPDTAPMAMEMRMAADARNDTLTSRMAEQQRESDAALAKEGRDRSFQRERDAAAKTNATDLELLRQTGRQSAANGPTVTSNEDGTITFNPGGRKLTEGEQKTAMYLTRASGALANVNKIEGAGYDAANAQDRFAARAPLGNVMRTPSGQKYEQAAKEFLAAILRKDSGAQITDSEWASFYPQYFPVYGDGDDVKAQKAEARVRALDALKSGIVSADGAGQPGAPPAGGGNDPLGMRK